MTARFSLQNNINTTAGEITCAITYVCGSQDEECRLRREMINQFCERNEIAIEDLITMRLQDIIFVDFYRDKKTPYNTLVDVYRKFIEAYGLEKAALTQNAAYKLINRLTKRKKNGHR